MSSSVEVNKVIHTAEWDYSYEEVLLLYCGGFLYCVVIFALIAAVAGRGGEQRRIIYAMRWVRLAVTGSVISQTILVYLYWMSSEPLIPPYYGVARPFLGSMLGLFGIFSHSHVMFRWIFGIGSSVFVIADTYSAWRTTQWLSCDGNECNPLYTRENMVMLKYRDYFAIGIDIWCILLAGYLCVAQGFFHSRYHFINGSHMNQD